MSNFNTIKLEELLAFAKIPPAVDQVTRQIYSLGLIIVNKVNYPEIFI